MPAPAGLQPRPRPMMLVVDDEPLMAEYMASVAEQAGWSVDLAITAAEFEAKVKADQPDMVVLDLGLPDRDGVELLRYLSSTGYLGNLIIASAFDEAIVETSAMLAREQGLAVSGYLQKPVAAQVFTSMLEQVVTMIPPSALDGGHQ
jgi:DNA-binding response OmpR family regulator